MITTLTRRARAAAAGLAALTLLGAAAPAAAEPALWTIRDADSTIYIFGTVHVLRPDTKWRSPKIEKALAESQELVVEVAGMDDATAAQPLMMKYGMDPSGSTLARLSEADRARLTAAAQSAGLPVAAIDKMRPWLAALTLTIAPVLKAGYDPQSGVEMVLTREAKAAGRPISALETLEQQVRFFADMPPAVELAFLRSTLDQVADGPARLDRMVTAWAAGDQKTLEAEFVTEVKGQSPELYQTVVVARNRDWADQLKKKLDGKGVSFVAVGAGHLVGPDSVQRELEKRGVKVERR